MGVDFLKYMPAYISENINSSCDGVFYIFHFKLILSKNIFSWEFTLVNFFNSMNISRLISIYIEDMVENYCSSSMKIYPLRDVLLEIFKSLC